MTVTLMTNTSATDVVSKQTSTISTEECAFKDNVSMLRPILILEGTPDKDINYCYIPDFGRYYYAKPTVLYNNMYELECMVDPLMSFDKQIRANHGIINKSANLYNMYLNDGSLQAYQDSVITTQLFPGGFNNLDRSLLLICAGRGV